MSLNSQEYGVISLCYGTVDEPLLSMKQLAICLTTL